MTTLKELRQRGRVEQILSGAEETAEYRAQALGVLLGLGLEPEAAGAICDAALERETLSGYEPDSVQRQDLALAAMETIISLYTRAYEDRPITVSRAQFDVDPEIQIRVYGLDDDRVEQYRRAMQAGDEFPPVVAFWDGEILRLADGFHRLAAMPSTRLTVLAEVRTGGYAAASEYAATCNASHGLGMSRADKRAAVKRLLHIHEDLSSREIARRVGVSHPFVEGLRKQTGADPEERTVIRGDQEYTISTERDEPEEAQEPEYAEVWELERGIHQWISAQCNGDASVSERYTILFQLKQRTHWMKLNPFLPSPRRLRDLIQAVNNVLEQLRHQQKRDAEAKAADARGNGGDDWRGYEDESESQKAEKPAPPTVNSARDRMITALLKADPQLLRIRLNEMDVSPMPGLRLDGAMVQDYPYDLSAAMHLIIDRYGYLDKRRMIYSLYKAIVESTVEDQDNGERMAACPDCGGDLVEKPVQGNQNGKTMILCEGCGRILEPTNVWSV